jgi:hypothetical protein
VQFLGAFQVPRTGTLDLFDYIPLTDVLGVPIAIPANPVGSTNTLRLTASGANNDLALNFLLLVPGVASANPLVSVMPPPNAVGVPGDATVEAAIYDGSNPVSQGSVKLFVGGSEVAATVAKSGGLTTVRHSPTTPWAPGNTFAMSLTYNDGTNRTNNWSFTVTDYPVLTPPMKVTDASVAGFVWRIHQNEANQDTTIQKALDAISGQLGLQNLADPNVQGPASSTGTPSSPGNGAMTFNIPTVINVGQDTFSDEGNFIPDEQMPGIPGLNLSSDGIAVEVTTFIQLPVGFFTMGVNSDDGFRTTAGFLNNNPLILGQFEGGRSAADSIFQFGVQEAGTYAFRTIYYEGNGGAALEWFLVKSDGSRVLINDTTNGGPSSFQQGTIPTGPTAVVVTATRNASGQVVIQWSSGTLQSADNVNGPYAPVVGAVSPHSVNPADAPRKYYRVQVQ